MAIHDVPELPRWATGATATVIEPDESIKDAGYNSTFKPVREFDNWLTKYTYYAIKHVLESGITGYNDELEFKKGAVCVGRDWKLYQSQQDENINNDPETDDGTWWKAPNFPDATEAGHAITKGQLEAGYITSEGATVAFLAKASNLSDLSSKPAARTNLGVYGKSEVFTKAETNAEIDAKLKAGSGVSTSDSEENFYFESPFATDCISVVTQRNTANGEQILPVVSCNKYGFIIDRDSSFDGNHPFTYIAVGY